MRPPSITYYLHFSKERTNKLQIVFLQPPKCYVGDPFSSGPGITISPSSLDYTYGDFGEKWNPLKTQIGWLSAKIPLFVN